MLTCQNKIFSILSKNTLSYYFILYIFHESKLLGYIKIFFLCSCCRLENYFHHDHVPIYPLSFVKKRWFKILVTCHRFLNNDKVFSLKEERQVNGGAFPHMHDLPVCQKVRFSFTSMTVCYVTRLCYKHMTCRTHHSFIPNSNCDKFTLYVNDWFGALVSMIALHLTNWGCDPGFFWRDLVC